MIPLHALYENLPPRLGDVNVPVHSGSDEEGRQAARRDNPGARNGHDRPRSSMSRAGEELGEGVGGRVGVGSAYLSLIHI